MPSGESWVAQLIEIPNWEPSPSRRTNASCSTVVVMINTSRMPASISVDNG